MVACFSPIIQKVFLESLGYVDAVLVFFSLKLRSRYKKQGKQLLLFSKNLKKKMYDYIVGAMAMIDAYITVIDE